MAYAVIDEAPPSTFPSEVVADWKDQDGSNATVAKVKADVEKIDPEIAKKITDGTDYNTACHWRRVARLKYYPENRKISCTQKHYAFWWFRGRIS